jgi:hypothetical protein
MVSTDGDWNTMFPRVMNGISQKGKVFPIMNEHYKFHRIQFHFVCPSLALNV